MCVCLRYPPLTLSEDRQPYLQPHAHPDFFFQHPFFPSLTSFSPSSLSSPSILARFSPFFFFQSSNPSKQPKHLPSSTETTRQSSSSSPTLFLALKKHYHLSCSRTGSQRPSLPRRRSHQPRKVPGLHPPNYFHLAGGGGGSKQQRACSVK